MRDEAAFEAALADLQNAKNSRGLRIDIRPRMLNAQGFLQQIHNMTQGIPMDMRAAVDVDGHAVAPTGTPELYANLADNLILLAKAMRASIRGLK